MKKLRIVSFILTLAILSVCFPVTLAGASNDIIEAKSSDFEYMKFSDHIALGEYSGNDTKIRLPSEIEGLPVTEILNSAFPENQTLQYVELPETIQKVAGRAFNLCSALTEFSVSPENQYLASKDGVLYSKDMTTLIIFPTGKGGSFTIPESVTTIRAYAFESCYNLTDVTMYNNVLTIQQFAFAYCWNLRSIKLSDNLKTLGMKALAYCDNLLEIHLPATLKIIGTQALIGGIDSDDNVYYNFINGLYYVKGTKSENFVKNLHLVPGYTFEEPRSITDIDTGVILYDSEGALPEGGKITFKANIISNKEFIPLLPVRYNEMITYDIEFLSDGEPLTLSKDAVIKFTGVDNSAPTAAKVYIRKNGQLVEKSRAPQAAFIGTTFTKGRIFVVISNNDFSLKGDIDGDGIHTIYDVRIALGVAAKVVDSLTAEQKNAANVDGKSGIKTGDARKILRYAAGMDK